MKIPEHVLNAIDASIDNLEEIQSQSATAHGSLVEFIYALLDRQEVKIPSAAHFDAGHAVGFLGATAFIFEVSLEDLLSVRTDSTGTGTSGSSNGGQSR